MLSSKFFLMVPTTMLSRSISGWITATSVVVLCFLATRPLQRDMLEYLLHSFRSDSPLLLWNMFLMWDNSTTKDAALPMPLLPEVGTGRFGNASPRNISKPTMARHQPLSQRSRKQLQHHQQQGSVHQDDREENQQPVSQRQNNDRRCVKVGFHRRLATIRHYQPTDLPSAHHVCDDVILLEDCRYPKRPVDKEPPREPNNKFLEDAAQFSPDFVGMFEV